MTDFSATYPRELLALLAEREGGNLVVALSQSDYLVRELSTQLGVPEEKVVSYVTVLKNLGLVSERHSDANPADVFYRLDLDAMREALTAVGMAIHPVVAGVDEIKQEQPAAKKLRVLFLCTANSARSQMAEGLMRHFSKGAVEVFSAGSVPSTVHPLAIETMARAGIDISQHTSKHMDELAHQQFDYVITVCDHQHEACPIFPGEPERIHWSLPDPAKAEPDEVQERAFTSTANHLRQLIRHFLIILERKGALS